MRDVSGKDLVSNRFQILALDGGGIRGVFSAAVLAALEQDLGGSVVDRFDLIAGTSTGGVIAIGLGLGMSPAEILELYGKLGATVFRDSLGLRSVQQWFYRKFPSSQLERALQGAFGARRFGESKKRLVVPSYNLVDDDVYLFRTPHAERLRRDYKVLAAEVALATTAAPTYFPAHRGVDDLRLIDGGVWANNPAMVAIVEAFGTLKVPLDDIRLLSVGTYDAVQGRPPQLDSGGTVAWATNAVDVVLRAGSVGVCNQARFLLGEERFLRINPGVPKSEVVLDNAGSMETLLARAAHSSRRFMPEIQAKFDGHTSSEYEPLYSV